MAYAAWDGPSSQYSYADGDFRSLWIAPVTFSGSTPVIAAGEAPEGYVLAASDGGIFAFGAAGYHGSMGGHLLDAPVVGSAADHPTGRATGWWRPTAGSSPSDAGFFGSMGGQPLVGPVLGMAPTPDGEGYWLVASDGGVFTFGTPPSTARWAASPWTNPCGHGRHPRRRAATGWWRPTAAYSASATPPSTARWPASPSTRPVVGMAATHDDGGYWLVAADGGVFPSATPSTSVPPATSSGPAGGGLLPGPGGGGYWLAAADGGLFTFGDAAFDGSMGGTPLAAPVVGGSST